MLHCYAPILTWLSVNQESLYLSNKLFCVYMTLFQAFCLGQLCSPIRYFRRDVQSLSYPTKSLTSSWDLKAFLTTYGFILNNLDTMHDLIGQKLMGYCGGKLTENLLLVTIVYKSKRKLVNDSPPAHDPQAFFMFSHNHN